MPQNYGGYTLDELANAVAQIETSGGKNNKPRYEPGFEKRYLRGKPQWEKLAAKYGWQAVSSSYGKNQIMFPVAVELGFQGSPQELADDKVNREYFEKKFTRDFQKSGGNLSRTLLRYNGGGNPNYPNMVMKYLPKKQPIAAGGPQMPNNMMNDVLYQVDKGLRQRGHPPMDAATLKEVYSRMEHPEVKQAIQSGQLNAEKIIQEVEAAIKGMKNPGPQPMQQAQAPQQPMPMVQGASR